jgi:hypothetical protein
MVQNWHWTIQDPPLLFCPTLRVEHLSLIKPYRVVTIYLKPFELENTILVMHYHHTKNNPYPINGGMCRKELQLDDDKMPS